MTYQFGNVPHPSYLDRPIVKPAGFGQDNLGRRSVKGVVYHRMIGSLWGTDNYFRLPSVGALTDYGVGTAPQDGTANDGLIIRWNDPLGLQSGWASGTYSSFAYGDGAAFVAKYGIDAINRDQASIEVSGLTYETPITDKTIDSIARISAFWGDQYEIPWDKYPISPRDSFSFVRWHNEFGPDKGTKKCPGSVVMDATDDIILHTADLMKEYQTGNAGPEVPPVSEPVSIYPHGMDEGIASFLFGKVHGDPKGAPYSFNPTGPVSKRWLARGTVTGEWPALVSVRQFDDRMYFAFSDGWVIWRVGNGALQELK